MTLFEYLAVSVSIVLSFGVIRLLDALPFALAKERRYWVHIIWVINVAWTHVQFWWIFWSYNSGVDWNYARFMIVLLPPGVLYSLALTLVGSEPEDIASFQVRFESVRVRFYRLFALWFATVALSTWLVLGQPFLHPVRGIQVGFIIFFLGISNLKSGRIHGVLAVAIALALLFSVTVYFLRPAPLAAP